ncbi:MAG: hypothetical protein ACP5UA_00280 [Candidatus Hydrogenedens sp.]
MKHTKLMTQKVSTLETASASTIISIIATVLTAIAGLLSALGPIIAKS